MEKTTEGSEAVIEIRDVHKRFGGTRALDGMTFDVRPGRITGFVGPNGAGKSTTMRVVLGLDAPDRGTALIGGRPYRSLRTPLTRIGALLDAAAVQPGRTARHHLLWLAHSQGLGTAAVDAAIRRVGLTEAAGRRAGGFSLGMRQRLGIAAALLGDPPVLMLDEPFNGLDPEGFRWMRSFLAGFAGQGGAVLVSSHLMSELQDTAHHVVVVGRGRVIADTGVRELLDSVASGRVTLRTTDRSGAMTALARAGATVSSTGGDTVTVAGLAAEDIVAALAVDSVPFSEVAAHRATLEEAYMELTSAAAQFRAGGAE
ncbi:ATP-binding cassette domain-containing protein [Streptomyces sp. NPDC001478]